MKGRGLVVFLALILATLATAGVFMYSRGVQEEAKTGGTMVQVVVSKVDIPARTDLDQLIKDDQFRIIQVPESVVVDGAVTSIDQLAGKSNSVAILAGEQIPVARISGNVPGGALAIPEGMEAITVSLDAPRGVAGAINAGDHVTIYSTFKDAPAKGAEKETTTARPRSHGRAVGGVPSARDHHVRRRRAQSTERAASRLADRHRSLSRPRTRSTSSSRWSRGPSGSACCRRTRMASPWSRSPTPRS